MEAFGDCDLGLTSEGSFLVLIFFIFFTASG
jgi:hypothetical protein